MCLSDDFYVVSDTHFYHDNIRKFCNRDTQIAYLVDSMPHLSYVKRGPWSQEDFMIQQWNSVVGKDDKVLHLGDWYLWRADGGARFASEILPRLNGDIYTILGNHDKPDAPWAQWGIKVLGDFSQKIAGRKVSFSHYPLFYTDLMGQDYRRHIHGHIHNNGYPKAKGEHGFQHGTVKTAPNQRNVSVEMIDYKPVHIREVIK